MKRMLMKVEAVGQRLILDDDSRWEVNPGDTPTTCTWIPTALLSITRLDREEMYPYEMWNEEADVRILARLLA